MSKPCFKRDLVTSAVLAGLAVGLHFAPTSFGDRVHATVLDAAAPGQRLVGRASEYAGTAVERLRTRAFRLADAPERHSDPADRAEIESWKLRYRRLQIAAAALRSELDDLQNTGHSTLRATAGTPLLVPELLEATVLGQGDLEAVRADRFINRGNRDGIDESAMVLDATHAVIDQGEAAAIEPDQAVYAGRAVIGRISRVGRLTSTVRLVTDAEFHAHAQLARTDGERLSFGAQGVLEGAGERLCRMKYVRSTDAVAVGDDVYTAGNDHTLQAPMYLGRVVKAELKPGAPQWDVWVEPAIDLQRLHRVMVLRKTINPLRLADGNSGTHPRSQVP